MAIHKKKLAVFFRAGVAEHLAQSFDILLMGDMFFDEILGRQLSNLASSFKNAGGGEEKLVLIGDPGRWLLSEKSQEDGQQQQQLKCLAKYDLGVEMKQQHFGLLNGFVYEFQP